MAVRWDVLCVVMTRGTGMSSIELFTSRFLVERGVGWVRVSRDGRLVEGGMTNHTHL